MRDPRRLPQDVVEQMQKTVEVCGIAYGGGDPLPAAEVICNEATSAAAKVLALHAEAWLAHLQDDEPVTPTA